MKISLVTLIFVVSVTADEQRSNHRRPRHQKNERSYEEQKQERLFIQQNKGNRGSRFRASDRQEGTTIKKVSKTILAQRKLQTWSEFEPETLETTEVTGAVWHASTTLLTQSDLISYQERQLQNNQTIQNVITSANSSQTEVTTPITTTGELSSSLVDIIGGQYADPTKYPWFTSVVSDSLYLCGAALVAPDIVLSAAHCQVAFEKGAVIGATRLLTDTAHSIEVEVVQKYIHPYFKTYHNYDVMLVQISPPIFEIDPVSINLDPALPIEGDSLMIMGFGRTTDQYGTLSEDLLDAVIYEVETSSCQTFFPNVFAASHLCAWNENPLHSPCNGDSGGPILDSAGQVVGMLSYSRKVCSEGPSVWTRTSGFADWIQQEMCTISQYPPPYLQCGSCLVEELAYKYCLSSRMTQAANDACVQCINANYPVNTPEECSAVQSLLCVTPYSCPCGDDTIDDAGHEPCSVMLQRYLQCQFGCKNICTQNGLAPVPEPQTASPALYLPDDDAISYCEKINQGCHESNECCDDLSCYNGVCVTTNSVTSYENMMPGETFMPISMKAPSQRPLPLMSRSPANAPTDVTTYSGVASVCQSSSMMCNKNQDCCSGLSCLDSVCQVLTGTVILVPCLSENQLCTSDEDCCTGLACFDGECLANN